MKGIRLSLIIVLLLLSIFISIKADAFDHKQTHPKITENAVYSGKTESILINSLGFSDGLKSTVNKKTITDWLTAGSTNEDEPPCRASNHFHNPIRNSEVTDFLYKNTVFADAVKAYFLAYCNAASPEYIPWHSNLEWATGSTKNERDWRHTRNAYYLALTSTTKQERENYFAATFYGLGHVLHMLQDTAVPAHVRNEVII